jgi:hypothetical protein
MHGMLSAAIVLIAFALVAAAGGGSTVWLYRAVSGPPRRSRPARETAETTPADAPETVPDAPPVAVPPGLTVLEDLGFAPVAATQGDDQEPVAEITDSGRPALPAAAPPPPALAAPGPASARAELAGGEPSGAGTDAGTGAGEAEPEGARIYVLDSSRRSRS